MPKHPREKFPIHLTINIGDIITPANITIYPDGEVRPCPINLNPPGTTTSTTDLGDANSEPSGGDSNPGPDADEQDDIDSQASDPIDPQPESDVGPENGPGSEEEEQYEEALCSGY